MSATIDERVVSMQFDNKQFESNVQTSIGTLDKLKQSLNFDGASKGLDNVNAAAKGVNFSGLSNAVETVRTRFSALEVMAVTALANITNSAVNAGKRLISAFTLDPVKTGLAEYETQIGAIQTILANTQSKGSTMDDVNAALDELNKYADKTIYNFTEMTRNIGTFTAAGVDLDKSVTSIKGIANLAAISGSTSQQASTAMYQLSQALASGTVKLQDWNSVVNAGMGGEVFQTALKRTATQMGHDVDAMIEKYGSFRESLTQGSWLTAEVLTETLTQLSGAYTEADLLAKGYSKEQAKEILELADTAESAATDVKTFTQLMDTLKESAQSGWTQTWEILVGDFEEAKALWSSVSDVFGGIINSASEARNKLLGGALSKSTWGEFTKKIEEAGVSTERFQESVRTTAQKQGVDIDKIIDKYGDFEHAVKAGAISTDILKKGLDGVNKTASQFNLENIGRTLKRGISGDDVKEVEKALESLGYKLTGKDGKQYADDGFFGTLTEEAIKDFQKLNNLKVTGMVDEATLKALDEATKKAGKLDDSVYNLIDGFDNLNGRDKIIEGVSSGFNGLKNIIKPIKDAFRDIFPPATAEQLYNVVDGFAQLTEKFETWTTSAEGQVVIANIASAFKGFFSIIDIGWTLVTSLTTGIFNLLGSLLGLGGGIAGAAGGIGEWITGLRNSIKESNIFGTIINGIVGFLQNGINAIKKFFSFVGEGLNLSGWDGFMSVLKGIWNFMQKIGGLIAGFGKAIGNIFMAGGFGEIISLANGGLFAMLLMNVSKFVKGFTETVESGGGLFESIKDALGGVKEILDGVGEALTAWTQNIKANIVLKIAAAIGILALALALLASIEPAKLSSALTAITVLFGELMLSLNLFSKTGVGEMKGVTKAVTAMIGVSTAVLILATALKQIASLGWEELAKGLVGVVALTGVIIGAAKAMSKIGGKAMKGAGQMVILAAALKILASVCKDLGALSWGELAKGLIGVGVLMTAVSVFMNKTKFDSKSIASAAGMVILAGAIKILASACGDFGEMSWESIAKGLSAIAVVLLELWAFTKFTKGSSGIMSTSIALIAIAAAMKIFASAITDLGALSWNQLGVGLAGLAGALLAVALTTKLMPKNLIGTGIGLVAVGASLLIVADALNTMGGMSWDSVAKSLITLGGSMLILAGGLHLMKGTLAGSAALLVASASLAVLAPVLKTLGEMSWGSIVKGLVAIAGAFVILGVAGAVLGPLVPAILGLSGALALVGIGMLAVGAGVFALGAGIAALASGIAIGGTAIVSGITSIILAIINLIPDAAKALGRGIVEFCKAIGDSADAIGEAFTKVLLSLVDVFVDCVPALAEGLLVLIDELLKSLAAHTPSIVESVVNVLFGIFKGVADALKNVDANVFLNGLLGIGVIAAIIAALAAIAPMIPIAMIGALGMAAIVGEIAILLAAIGALAQIPGLKWLVGEGGQLLQAIGTALGQFVGGLVGGVVSGFTALLPQIATDLSTFMTNLDPFLTGASKINKTVVEGVNSIAGIILTLTGASIVESLTSWLTGGSSLSTFGTELAAFGVSLSEFSTSVTGIDATAVTTAITAAKSLVDVAVTIPTTGGIVSWFTGDNDMATFGSQLKSFGIGIKGFSDAVIGVDATAVTTAVTAAKSLADIAATIPTTGGVVSWFTGDQDLTAFGTQLKSFGAGVKGFADAVMGIDATSVTTGITAAKSLIDISATIPNTGGVVSWFTGDQDLVTFGTKLSSFGAGVKAFADSVAGIDATSVTTGITAAKSLIDAAITIPTTGGVVTWFTGDQDLATFGTKLVAFGTGVKSFADSVAGIDSTSITTGITAAKSLIDIAATIPTTGGVISWFTGDQDLATFGTKISSFGSGIKAFADSVVGIDSTSITTGITAAKSLIDAAATIPTTGGVVSWFTGDQDLATFGTKLSSFGGGVKAFADSVVGIDSTSLTAGITAAKSLIDVAVTIPTTGGVVSWFTGEQDLATFGTKLSSFGGGVKAFADSVVGIDSASITAGITAAKGLIDVAVTIPTTGGVVGWFTGKQDLTTFGTQLGSFGSGVKAFADAVVGIDSTSMTTGVTAAKGLIDVAITIPTTGGVVDWFTGKQDLTTFGSQLGSFGSGIKAFADAVVGIDSTSVTAGAAAAKSLIDVASTLPATGGVMGWFTGKQDLTTFGSQLGSFGGGIKSFADAVTGIDSTSVTTAIATAENLIKISSTLPTTGGIMDWFTGKQDLSTFGSQLKSFGTGIKGFSDAVVGMDGPAIVAAITAAKELSTLASNLPESKNINNMQTLAAKAKSMGKELKGFSDSLTGINWTSVTNATTSLNSLSTTLSSMPTSFAGANSFKSALKNISKTSINDFVTEFTNAEKKVISAGEKLIGYAVTGIKNKKSDISTSLTSTVSAAAKAITVRGGSVDIAFRNAGRFVVDGIVSGVGGYLYKAKKAGLSLAKTILAGIEEGLDINSPSRYAYEDGEFTAMGLINALHDYERKTYRAGYDVGESTESGLRSAISKIRSVIENDIDTQPTIRPVLDLSSVTAGTGTLSRMLDMRSSVGIATRFGAINSMMSNRQNGSNDDLISAIKGLGDKLDGASGDTYQFAGITYDDGSNITEAVKSLAHAVKLERRI